MKKKNQLFSNEFNLELIPLDDNFEIKEYKVCSYEKIAGLGSAFMPVIDTIKNIATKGGSGVYRVDTKGGVLQKFKNGAGYLGSSKINGAKGFSQAILNPVVFNPALLGVTLVFASIESQLVDIKEAIKEILDYMQDKDKSKLYAGCETLMNALNDYSNYYRDNKNVLDGSIHDVRNVMKDARELRAFYGKKLNEEFKCKSFDYCKIEKYLQLYNQSLYLMSFGEFLLVFLEERYTSKNVDSEMQKFNKWEKEYNIIIENCYEIDINKENNVIEKFLLWEASKVNKIPFIGKFYEKQDKKIVKNNHGFDKTLLQKMRQSPTQKFSDGLLNINLIFNKPLDILISGEKIYIKEGK